MLNNLDLNKLRAFYYVHERRSLLLASRDLGVTASAVSQAIRGLERELGRTLFARAGKRYLPSEAAARLFAVVAPWLAKLDAFVQGPDDGAPRGRVTCGAPFAYGATRLGEHAEAFLEKYPGAQVAVSLLDTQRLYDAVLDNRLDLAVCDELPKRAVSPLIEATPLCAETLVMCASRAYWREHEGEVTLKHLRTLEYVPYVARHEAVHKWFEHHFGRVPEVRWRYMVDSVVGVRQAVLAGRGLGVLPEAALAGDAKKGRLVVLATRKPPLVNRMVVVRLRDRVSTPVQRRFVEHLVAAEAPEGRRVPDAQGRRS